MGIKHIFLFFLALLMTSDFVQAKKPCPTATHEALVYAAQNEINKADRTGSTKDRIQFLKRGYEWADQCVTSFPQEVGCYYYRALNAELLVETGTFETKYPVSQILGDCEKVLQMQSEYDNRGIGRILSGLQKYVTRKKDKELVENFLEKVQ